MIFSQSQVDREFEKLMSPNEWKLPFNEVPLPHSEEWTIEKLKAVSLKIWNEGLSEPQDICGIVDFPLWDFIPVIWWNWLVNDAMSNDSFYDTWMTMWKSRQMKKKQQGTIVSLQKFHFIGSFSEEMDTSKETQYID